MVETNEDEKKVEGEEGAENTGTDTTKKPEGENDGEGSDDGADDGDDSAAE